MDFARCCPARLSRRPQAHAQGAFYDASAAEIARGPPGSVIRDEPMVGAPAGGIAHRVLYRSTGPKGEPIAVSGVIIVPPGVAPPGGWPIVAWAHPTIRHRAALRAVARDLPVPADRRQPADDRAGLRHRCDRLSRASARRGRIPISSASARRAR